MSYREYEEEGSPAVLGGGNRTSDVTSDSICGNLLGISNVQQRNLIKTISNNQTKSSFTSVKDQFLRSFKSFPFDFTMCGIIGYFGENNFAPDIVFNGLKKLEYRGYDSWGIACTANNSLILLKQVGKISLAKNKLPQATISVGHTRWATHGGVTKTNAHPHIDCAGEIAIVHNGIVENWEILKKDLLKKGHKFISQTDSEIIAHLIEEEQKNQPFTEAVIKISEKIKGLNAFAAIDSNSKKLIGICLGSPLNIGFGKDEYFLASDVLAFSKHTNIFHNLKSGQIAVIDFKGLQITNCLSKSPIIPIKEKISWKENQTDKGQHKHFMIKEISEQPRIIADILKRKKEIQKFSGFVKKHQKIFLVGCGTALLLFSVNIFLICLAVKKQLLLLVVNFHI